jgi:hypothetical protein
MFVFCITNIKFHTTVSTGVGFFSCVNSHMHCEITVSSEPLTTHTTLVVCVVVVHVSSESMFLNSSIVTMCTLVLLVPRVC